ncbi:hydroxysqualene dehydroxylase [Saccharopolyspora rosea]|uniref:FAD-dependent oxidoreductase n=1 Tax=Saccharopolyspora rosea TaxID=524884 RepID=A0ABW3FNG6_9PSEU|nr:FAD-dependent oxidoreductase [Saccharopolyspora rosea]
MGGRGASRRTFLVGAAAGLAGLGAGGAAATGRPSVAVLGGGVAGMTAAHELAERGFAVTVYERRALGGKARSIPVPGSGRGGRRDLPGEHGFRIFFGFYHNLPDTLRRIPVPGNPDGVRGNLVNAAEALYAFADGRADLHVPWSLGSVPESLLGQLSAPALLEEVRALVETTLHLPPDEALLFARRLLVYLTSCEERRGGQWDFTTWPDFLRANGKSHDYQRILVSGPTRVLSATRTANASAHTVGVVLEQLLFTVLGRGADGQPDRVLNAPTNEAWIDPWERHLRRLGVEFRIGWTVDDLVLEGGRIARARVRDPRGRRLDAEAEHFVCALPVEHARRVWNERLLAADPRLRAAATLETQWMVGLQFYLDRPTPIARGHVYYVDSPWALTSVSQAGFWPDRDLPADYGDGRAADCLSMIISDWDRPGILFGRPARELAPEQIARETWAQLRRHLDDTGRSGLGGAVPVSWFLDPGVTGLGGPHPGNADELVVHPVGSWHRRPPARTAVPNLFLAGDYVAVPINAASMEGANTAARMAVNALLDEAGSSAPRAAVHDVYHAPEFELLKAEDQAHYRLGLPNLFDVDR